MDLLTSAITKGGNIVEVVESIGTKRDALQLVEMLINGTCNVDVNTEIFRGTGVGGFLSGTPLMYVLKALGVQTIPVDWIAMMHDIEKYYDAADNNTGEEEPITIMFTHIFDIEEMQNSIRASTAARGLIASLLDGCTHIDGENGILYWCYGTAPQSYATIEAVYGEGFTDDDIISEYVSYWNDACEVETMGLVDQLVDLLLIDNDEDHGRPSEGLHVWGKVLDLGSTGSLERYKVPKDGTVSDSGFTVEALSAEGMTPGTAVITGFVSADGQTGLTFAMDDFNAVELKELIEKYKDSADIEKAVEDYLKEFASCYLTATF
jgi:hypothetical protein